MVVTILVQAIVLLSKCQDNPKKVIWNLWLHFHLDAKTVAFFFFSGQFSITRHFSHAQYAFIWNWIFCKIPSLANSECNLTVCLRCREIKSAQNYPHYLVSTICHYKKDSFRLLYIMMDFFYLCNVYQLNCMCHCTGVYSIFYSNFYSPSSCSMANCSRSLYFLCCFVIGGRAFVIWTHTHQKKRWKINKHKIENDDTVNCSHKCGKCAKLCNRCS